MNAPKKCVNARPIVPYNQCQQTYNLCKINNIGTQIPARTGGTQSM